MSDPGSLRRLALLRHGETVGNSSVRFYGRTDVALSEEGREQARSAGLLISQDAFDVVLASPLCRAWQSAAIVAPGRQVRLVPEFQEIDFGRWEGLTKEEIEASNPVLYNDWQAKSEGFEYPEGERAAAFRARVLRGLESAAANGAISALIVCHKGVVRAIVADLTSTQLPPAEPELGGVVLLSRDANGEWFPGRRSSNPPGI